MLMLNVCNVGLCILFLKQWSHETKKWSKVSVIAGVCASLFQLNASVFHYVWFQKMKPIQAILVSLTDVFPAFVIWWKCPV